MKGLLPYLLFLGTSVFRKKKLASRLDPRPRFRMYANPKTFRRAAERRRREARRA